MGYLRVFFLLALAFVLPGGAFVVGVWCAALYFVRQGTFDGEIVRFARAMSLNDETTVRLAKELVRDKAAAWDLPELSELFHSAWNETATGTAVALVLSERALPNPPRRGLSHAAAFDGKEDGEVVAEFLDAMLSQYDAPLPPEAARTDLIAELDAKASVYTSAPIVLARYDRFFRAAGLRLMHVNTSSDSYLLVALPEKMGEAWEGVTLPAEPKVRYASPIIVEPAIVQAETYIRERMPDLIGLLESRRENRPVPDKAGLPLRMIVRSR